MREVKEVYYGIQPKQCEKRPPLIRPTVSDKNDPGSAFDVSDLLKVATFKIQDSKEDFLEYFVDSLSRRKFLFNQKPLYFYFEALVKYNIHDEKHVFYCLNNLLIRRIYIKGDDGFSIYFLDNKSRTSELLVDQPVYTSKEMPFKYILPVSTANSVALQTGDMVDEIFFTYNVKKMPDLFKKTGKGAANDAFISLWALAYDLRNSLFRFITNINPTPKDRQSLIQVFVRYTLYLYAPLVIAWDQASKLTENTPDGLSLRQQLGEQVKRIQEKIIEPPSDEKIKPISLPEVENLIKLTDNGYENPSLASWLLDFLGMSFKIPHVLGNIVIEYYFTEHFMKRCNRIVMLSDDFKPNFITNYKLENFIEKNYPNLAHNRADLELILFLGKAKGSETMFWRRIFDSDHDISKEKTDLILKLLDEKHMISSADNFFDTRISVNSFEKVISLCDYTKYDLFKYEDGNRHQFNKIRDQLSKLDSAPDHQFILDSLDLCMSSGDVKRIVLGYYSFFSPCDNTFFKCIEDIYNIFSNQLKNKNLKTEETAAIFKYQATLQEINKGLAFSDRGRKVLSQKILLACLRQEQGTHIQGLLSKAGLLNLDKKSKKLLSTFTNMIREIFTKQLEEVYKPRFIAKNKVSSLYIQFNRFAQEDKDFQNRINSKLNSKNDNEKPDKLSYAITTLGVRVVTILFNNIKNGYEIFLDKENSAELDDILSESNAAALTRST